MNLRRACFIGLAVLLLGLSGCVKYNETIEFDENGKGKATLVLNRPKRGLIDKVRAMGFDGRFAEAAMGKDLPAGVKLDWTESEKDERVEVTATYHYDDINKLLGWATKSDTPLRDVSVTRKGKTIELTRTFRTLDKEELESVKKFAPDVVLSFKVIGPGKITETNATKQEGNTVTWEYKAPELFEGGKTFKVQYFFGVPGETIFLIALGVLIAAGIAFKVTRKKPAAPPAA